MDVVYCCNERYAEIFAVSLVSLYKNNTKEKDLNIYLIENGLSTQSRERLESLADKYQRKIDFISLGNKKASKQKLSLPSAYSIDTFSRLFMASLLPRKVERAIYIDCDTLVLESLRGLWEFDLDGAYAGMVNDCENKSYRRSLGLWESGIYYNAGVFVADLNLWRKHNIEDAFLCFINQCKGYIPIVDQGVMNAVLNGKIHTLPLKFNVGTAWFAFSYQELCKLRKPVAVYSREEVEKACKSPVVVHFTNNFFMPIRPWMQNCNHPYGQKWLQYREKTPWRETELWRDSRPGFAKAYTVFCHAIPNPVAIVISRVIQSYLFPLWHRYKRKRA